MRDYKQKVYEKKRNKKIKIRMAEVYWNPTESLADFKIVKPKDTEYRFSRLETKLMPLNEAKKLGNEFVIKERS